MAAFVSGFHGVQVGAPAENKLVCRAAKPAQLTMLTGYDSKSSPNFPNRAATRERRTVSFNARVARNKSQAKKILEKADEFFARSVTMQYKAFACPNGVYDIQCTEGTVKGAAYEKRAMAVSAAFRAKQASPAAKARALFENRRHAIIASHECQHEEDLFVRFPKLSAAYMMGKTEAMRTCSRYVVPDSLEEEYMAASVDRQMKERACPGGVYASSCVEGNAKGQAEQARVAALATAFRSAQKSASKTTAERYSSAAYGRDHFAHGCSYEESVFNTYPATAAAMRSKSYNY
ncbi:R-phycoerythrin gamma chain, chloroplastic [Porphyridium purpureum]|uniref:R-phycoerythrin gamma chain, chloroplastic n=1 Tax=Porphyridium purpureum TaxID=35688 RepID=A0A5J4YX19_PORPP|nr:Chain A2, LR4 [Porphyridium purpureum]6KGX_A6 Chain A6, LR4 [Porphyridium purpureum]6KGX_A7 Chain A7, LR4 [Porphyridium purpureum]6KGX_A9 Chain A9, LR4 [Porphyridium purpureum]6KGX_AB Chain AB, LR4 [Porphyridium purpureum]6KGX_AF Chain AF, LR4 [Porphyridium purpureum]6KGX_AI Chain AI, LR4 [Porphyridium purpureum]6KGX_AJ Chain AJ, LR4 [Porphyridium purpureum]6KGX_Y3 Chain Y3, LR4 [Porphyridium purpureum]6KGX_YD Chain YD, LR4 [Porphyridium purpureum]7EZX_A1 Chain A1, R-phycoerythrin gamm|eukprot:POR0379..scf209_3